MNCESGTMRSILPVILLVFGSQLTYINCKCYYRSSEFGYPLAKEDFEDVSGTCYYLSFNHAEKRTWEQARRFCQEISLQIAEKVDLAEDGNAASGKIDNLMLQTRVENGERVWLGGSDTNVEGTWTWVTSGRSITNLDHPSFSFSGSGDCLAAYFKYNSHRVKFVDWHCNQELAFVCQVMEEPQWLPFIVHAPECPSPWFRIGSQCFLGVTSLHTWASAQQYCSVSRAHGGDLAHPKDINALNDYLKNNGYAGIGNYWLGASDLATGGELRWFDGDTLTLGQASQECIGKRFDDDFCDVKRYSVCERPVIGARIDLEAIIGSQHLIFNQELLSWKDAVSSCKSNDGKLATIAHPNELLAYIGDNIRQEFWIGGSDSANEGRWVWINGEAFASSFPWSQPSDNSYGATQPDDYQGNQDCLVAGWQGGYGDQDCNTKMRFICEKRARIDLEAIIGSQHLIFSQEYLNWADAVSSCKSNDGKLASIAHPKELLAYIDEQGLVVRGDDFFNTGQEFWVGGSDSANEGRWVWNNGEAFASNFPWSQPSDNPYGSSEPNNLYGNQDCLVAGWQGGYDDQDCNTKMRFICEKECPSPWFRVDNKCFLPVIERLTWASAREYCGAKANGGDLAQLSNIKALNSYMVNNGYGDRWYHWYYWIRGSTDKPDGQDCIYFRPGVGDLNTDGCEKNNRFLCELPITIG